MWFIKIRQKKPKSDRRNPKNSQWKSSLEGLLRDPWVYCVGCYVSENDVAMDVYRMHLAVHQLEAGVAEVAEEGLRHWD